MSKPVETPAVAPEATEETPKKTFVFTRKQIAIAVAATAVVGAAVAVAYKVKVTDFSELSDVTEDALLELAVEA